MIDVVLKRAIEEYVSNFKVMLSFGVLFLFLPLFAFFSQFFLGSGTAFLSVNTTLLGIVGLILALIFLYIFSFFVSLTVYSVHRDVQTISFDDYWNTLFKDAALKIFFLYLVLSVIFYLVSTAGFIFGLALPALIINLVIGVAVMFAPQSIVLNESSIGESVQKSIEFWFENTFISFAIFLIATFLLSLIVLVELALDLSGLPGVVVSFILVMVFLVPFIEQTKSYAYLLRVDLLKSNEVTHARAPKFERPKPIYGVRLREQPKRGNKL
jgi:hypothetical protein